MPTNPSTASTIISVRDVEIDIAPNFNHLTLRSWSADFTSGLYLSFVVEDADSAAAIGEAFLALSLRMKGHKQCNRCRSLITEPVLAQGTEEVCERCAGDGVNPSTGPGQCVGCGRYGGLNTGPEESMDTDLIDPQWDGDGDLCVDCFEEQAINEQDVEEGQALGREPVCNCDDPGIDWLALADQRPPCPVHDAEDADSGSVIGGDGYGSHADCDPEDAVADLSGGDDSVCWVCGEPLNNDDEVAAQEDDTYLASLPLCPWCEGSGHGDAEHPGRV